MCGIIGYIGKQEVNEILLNGLKRLEYRGYDSAGVAIINGSLQVRKKSGKVSELDGALSGVAGTCGIGHTRWATHGVPNDENAHPHASSDGSFALVHNGIIENYSALREKLRRKGYEFKSQTDTEALVHLIADVKKETGLPLEEAIPQALSQVVGTYGIAVVSSDDDNLLIAARKGSPLILGVGEGEYYTASHFLDIVKLATKAFPSIGQGNKGECFKTLTEFFSESRKLSGKEKVRVGFARGAKRRCALRD